MSIKILLPPASGAPTKLSCTRIWINGEESAPGTLTRRSTRFFGGSRVKNVGEKAPEAVDEAPPAMLSPAARASPNDKQKENSPTSVTVAAEEQEAASRTRLNRLGS